MSPEKKKNKKCRKAKTVNVVEFFRLEIKNRRKHEKKKDIIPMEFFLKSL
jgi:hypothetical protein